MISAHIQTYLCKAIARKLAALARRCADGTLSVQQFIDNMLAIESREMHPLGLVLSATNTREDWVNVSLKVAGSGSSCAQFEFLPAGHQFRQVSPS